jgi:ABC-type antimicrobial peptide transport system permease subunit
VQQISHEHILFAPQTMRQIISDSLARRRFMMILLGAFAGLALLLAIVGIYGVMSYMVGLRTHEIGVRIALGARRGNILLLVLRDAGTLTAQGVALGLGAAFALTRLIAKLLYGVGPADPLTFTIVPAILVCVALLASYLPARRAAAVDPMRALRSE